MLVNGWHGTEVEVLEAGNGQTEVDEGVVGGVKARKNGVVVVDPTFRVVVDIERNRPGTADGDAVVQDEELDGGVRLQLLPDGLLWRGGEIEGGALY